MNLHLCTIRNAQTATALASILMKMITFALIAKATGEFCQTFINTRLRYSRSQERTKLVASAKGADFRSNSRMKTIALVAMDQGSKRLRYWGRRCKDRLHRAGLTMGKRRSSS
jgi:hypothetical protein